VAQFPWTQREQIDRGRDYVVMASLLPLTKYRSIPGFLRDTLAIRRQLRTAPGLVGYSLLAEETRKRFFTFSAWTDRESLDAFERTEPHRQIIRRLRPKMDAAVFEFSTVEGSRLPYTWEQVKAMLKVQDS
jgi:heme-degrading monooxygenase HmoA